MTEPVRDDDHDRARPGPTGRSRRAAGRAAARRGGARSRGGPAVAGHRRRLPAGTVASLTAPSRPPVAISRPTSFLSAVRPSTMATSSPRYMTAIRSDSSSTSSSSADTSRTAVPASRLAIDLPVDELDAADVEAARRLVEDEQPQVAVELARDDDLLLVAARQRAGLDVARTASGCRTALIRSSAVFARSRRRCAGRRVRTAAGGSWSGRGCRRCGNDRTSPKRWRSAGT